MLDHAFVQKRPWFVQSFVPALLQGWPPVDSATDSGSRDFEEKRQQLIQDLIDNSMISSTSQFAAMTPSTKSDSSSSSSRVDATSKADSGKKQQERYQRKVEEVKAKFQQWANQPDSRRGKPKL